MFRLNAVSGVTYMHQKDDINNKQLQQFEYSAKTMQQARIIFFFPSLEGIFIDFRSFFFFFYIR